VLDAKKGGGAVERYRVTTLSWGYIRIARPSRAVHKSGIIIVTAVVIGDVAGPFIKRPPGDKTSAKINGSGTLAG
jgi:hypothetical protein